MGGVKDLVGVVEFHEVTHLSGSPFNGFCVVEGGHVADANGALRAASVSARERKWVTLLFEAVQDVVPLRDVVGDCATLLAPVNRDPVAGTHEGLLAVPCYILTCPI